MKFISKLNNTLIPTGDMRNEQARLEHTTRAVFAIIGFSALLSTAVIIFLDVTAKQVVLWPIFMMLGVLLVHSIAWFLVQKGYWQFASHLPPFIFLLAGAILTSQPALIQIAILLYILSILLTSILLHHRWQWAVVILCSACYLIITEITKAEYSGLFLISRPIIPIIFVTLAVLLQISANIIKFTINSLIDESLVRKKAQDSAEQNEKLLSVVAQSAQMLVETSDWKLKIYDVLKLLGEAAQASHAYLFENHLDENEIELTSLRYEWENPIHNVSSHVADFQNVPLQHEEMMAWYKLLSDRKPFYDSTEDFPEDWASKESRKEIKTLLDVPIFVDGKWWGVIGFDDFTRVKPWSQVEVDAVQIAADLLGAVIKKQKADEAIKASEEKFQTTFHASLVPMVIGRIRDRLILDVNLAFSELTGFSREESVNHFPSDLGIWANQTEREQHREILKRQGHVREFKARLRKKTGDVAIVLLSVSSIKVNSEECLLYSIYEITQLEKALNDLQDKNNELERFTYTVSHDLKAPLITIGGFAGLLERDIKSNNEERVKKGVTRILDAVNKMERLLNELLSLSRIGRMINEPQEVAFEELAKEAVSLAQGRLAVTKMQVRIEAGLPLVKVDRIRIVEVIQNLLENASKFMGGQTNPEIVIGARQENETWIFFVRDNGIGIDPAYHERVFGLFNKLDPNTEGTGVGLALVKRIVEFHGGKVWVESQVGKGATFCFTLAG